eukprot:TRINITY_DN2488_c0_g1_i1.p3 TRINITY_DN2488_c0_g1~~TRINITY_DN2488_c0_g1_i1.p3  ORF type:complete len:57 (+),score=0.30 TRINITY_DN2488_c0_g1_i1:124-294(+)
MVKRRRHVNFMSGLFIQLRQLHCVLFVQLRSHFRHRLGVLVLQPFLQSQYVRVVFL